MNRTLWLAAIFAVPASILIACGGGDDSVVNDTDAGSGTDATTGTGTDSSTAADTGGGTVTDSGGGGKDSGPAVDPATCPDAGSAMACTTCCVSAYPNGEKALDDSITACACKGEDAGGDGGLCKQECAATVCAATPADPDKTCQNCLQKGGKDSCEGKGVAACQADTACKGLLACEQSCPKK